MQIMSGISASLLGFARAPVADKCNSVSPAKTLEGDIETLSSITEPFPNSRTVPNKKNA